MNLGKMPELKWNKCKRFSFNGTYSVAHADSKMTQVCMDQKGRDDGKVGNTSFLYFIPLIC